MNNYAKAYVELYEIIKRLPETEQNKIPSGFIANLNNNMDKTYKFKFDDNFDISTQNYLIETQALYIKLYKKYLMESDEKEIWNRYDKICLNMIEQEKKNKYNSNPFENALFTHTIETIPNSLVVIEQKRTIKQKIFDFIKKIKKIHII